MAVTKQTILEELDRVPEHKLEEVYSYLQSVTQSTALSEEHRNEILSYAGAFSDMSDEEFKEFSQDLKSMRNKLFNRDIDL